MFDTLLYTKKFEAAGHTREEAEFYVKTLGEMIVDGVATKSDLKIQEALTAKEFLTVRKEMGDLRSEMTSEFAAVRGEMASEFAAVRSEMASGFADVHHKMEKLETRLLLKLGGFFITLGSLSLAYLSFLISNIRG